MFHFLTLPSKMVLIAVSSCNHVQIECIICACVSPWKNFEFHFLLFSFPRFMEAQFNFRPCCDLHQGPGQHTRIRSDCCKVEKKRNLALREEWNPGCVLRIALAGGLGVYEWGVNDSVTCRKYQSHVCVLCAQGSSFWPVDGVRVQR